MPPKKTGTAMPSWASAFTAKPCQCRRFSAATMPAGKAISSEPTMPSPTSQAVTARRGPISASTGWLLRWETPKLPVSTPPSHSR